MPRKSRRTKPRKSQVLAEDWYEIRSILQERTVKGRVEYLVDWEDNKRTGEPYEPSWSEEVTAEALQEWRNKAAQPSEEISNGASEASQDSQPLRPANRRQLIQSKLDRDYSILEEPPSSIASTTSLATALDSAASIQGAPHTNHRFTIDISKNQVFDPADYISLRGTQEGSQSTQPVSELEEQDQRIALTSHLSQRVIPDSQDHSAESLPLSQPSYFVQSNISPSRGSGSSLSQSQAPAKSQGLQVSSAVFPEHGPQQTAPICLDQRRTLPVTSQARVSINQSTLERSVASIDCDIPPRQVESPSIQSEVLAASSEKSHRGEGPSVSSAQHHSEEESPATRTSQVAFLTQPDFQQVLIPGSSSASAQNSSGNLLVEDTSGEKDSLYLEAERETGDNTISQAAQVIERDSFSVVAQLAESHSNTHSAVSSGLSSSSLEAEFPTLPRDNSQDFVDSSVATLDCLIGSEAWPRLPVGNSDTRGDNASHHNNEIFFESSQLAMEEPSGGEPAPTPHQAAAVKELKDLFGLSDDSSQSAATTSNQAVDAVPSTTDIAKPPPSSTHEVSSLPEALHDVVPSIVSQVSAPAASWDTNSGMAAAIDDLQSGTLMQEASHVITHTTVSPADVSRPVGREVGLLGSISSVPGPTSPTNYDSAKESITMAQRPVDDVTEVSDSSSVLPEGTIENIVTLPFRASSRPLYDEILLQSRRDIAQFGAAFSDEDYVRPSDTLIDNIDKLFNRLQNLCDYPDIVEKSSLTDLSPVEKTKVYCESTPKLNFVYELLANIKRDCKVLVIARSTELLQILFDVTTALRVDCTCRSLGHLNEAVYISPAQVTLALPGENMEELDTFDLIVGYDSAFARSPEARRLSQKIEAQEEKAPGKRPLVLNLVLAHSIDHIDLEIPEDMSVLERKNALLLVIVQARELILDPDMGYAEPHETAKVFSSYINGETRPLVWEPIPFPKKVLDFYPQTQGRSQLPVDDDDNDAEENGARKRKLDDEDEEEGSKRIRIAIAAGPVTAHNEPPLPDEVSQLLEGVGGLSERQAGEARANVPVSVLQGLAQKIAEYERRTTMADMESEYKRLINELETQVKSHQKSSNRAVAALRAATSDRTTYQKQKEEAESRLKEAAQTAEKAAAKAQSRIDELEATIARLTTGSGGPDDETPLGKNERLLQEANDKVQSLQKRIENATQDRDYAYGLYRNATDSASAIGNENKQLQAQIAELTKRAGDNVTRIHEIQAANDAKQHMQQIRDLKAQLREREIELDHVREDLRSARNGRRETRQSSVPRSPRMGMMSPRPIRSFGPASRGTSPVPPVLEGGVQEMHLFNATPTNPRINHLRD